MFKNIKNINDNICCFILLLLIFGQLVYISWDNRDYLLAWFQKDDYLLSQAIDIYSDTMAEKPPEDMLEIIHTNSIFFFKVFGVRMKQLSMELESVLNVNSNAPSIDKKCIKRFIEITKAYSWNLTSLSKAAPDSDEYKILVEEHFFWLMRLNRLEYKYRRLRRAAIKKNTHIRLE